MTLTSPSILAYCHVRFFLFSTSIVVKFIFYFHFSLLPPTPESTNIRVLYPVTTVPPTVPRAKLYKLMSKTHIRLLNLKPKSRKRKRIRRIQRCRPKNMSIRVNPVTGNLKTWSPWPSINKLNILNAKIATNSLIM